MTRLLATVLVALTACDREPRSESQSTSAAPPAPTASANLKVTTSESGGQRFSVFTQPVAKLELRLKRPSRNDPSLLLSVPGTYTSPEGRVEGIVLESGRLVSSAEKPWEGLLVIEAGRPTLLRQAGGRVGAELLDELRRRRASVLQGHLLVFDRVAQSLKPSPALKRRAITTRRDGSFAIVESEAPRSLGAFATDLVALGSARAMNLDMGQWSEGFVRDPATRGVRRLGDDFRQTDRQTNWLVLVD